MITDSCSCPLANCPKSAQCSRHAFYLKALSESDVLTLLNTHKIAVGAEGCQHFIVPKSVRYVYGFKKLYGTIPNGNVRNFRLLLPFSSESAYYRAKRGDHSLTPDQQAAILRVVRDAGGDPSVGFDKYEDAIAYAHP